MEGRQLKFDLAWEVSLGAEGKARDAVRDANGGDTGK